MKKKWEEIKEETLGKKFNLSVVFVGNKLMSKLNKTYRKKTGASNVLSFLLSKEEGEIFINSKFGKKKYADFLFAHSVLHLKGMSHGKKMETEEKKLMEKYKINNGA
jgi:rRNA maturation RNase YbeY